MSEWPESARSIRDDRAEQHRDGENFLMKSDMLRPVFVSIALTATLSAQTAPRDEEFVRRQYESGLSFMQNKQYTEALKDFQTVVDSFPKSSVADDALLQIAMYQLDIARDVAA